MNKFINKKIKITVALILCIPCLFLFIKGMRNVFTYRSLNSKYTSIKEEMNKPLANSSLALTDGDSVEQAIKTIDGITEISMVSELDSSSYNVVNTLTADDIHTISNNIVEVTMKSTDIVNSLASLSTKMLVCDYINVDGEYITIRVSIGGGK